MKIEISKKNKKLRLIDKKSVVFSCACFTGFKDGQKEREGDMKTPEGSYRVVVKNPQSKYFLSVGLNYPNLKDVIRGYKNGVVGGRVFFKYVLSFIRKGFFSWYMPLGGEIFIHGEGDNTKEWTKGCIKVRNVDIQKIYDSISISDEVDIY